MRGPEFESAQTFGHRGALSTAAENGRLAAPDNVRVEESNGGNGARALEGRAAIGEDGHAQAGALPIGSPGSRGFEQSAPRLADVDSRIRRRGWLVRRMLLLADILGLFAAFVATQLAFEAGSPDRVASISEAAVFVALIPIWALVGKLYGLYDHDEERADHSTADDIAGVFQLATVGIWLIVAGAAVTHIGSPDLLRVSSFWAFAIAAVVLARVAARTIARRSAFYIQNTIIVGAGDVGRLIARKILHHPEYGLNVVGFVDTTSPKRPAAPRQYLPVLGPPARLPEIVPELGVERVIIAFTNDSHEDILALIRSLKDLDIQIDIVPRLFEIVGPGVGFHTIEGVPLVGMPPLRLPRSTQFVKRAMDISLAGIGLIVLAPFLLATAIVIKATSNGPVFFRQVRMGFRGKTFTLLKFRSMVADAEERKQDLIHMNMHVEEGGDARMFKIRDDPRVTRMGAFLRRYSFDELPQLINVIKGDMSLVGPRPLILDEDRQVISWARKRLDLKPGITGLWQVLGRSEIPFEEMTKLDYLYVTTWSPWRDLVILFRTIPAIFRPHRVY